MSTRTQILAIVITAGLFFFVFELVRRRRLMERYALLWLFSAAVLLLLAAWSGLLNDITDFVGIQTPSNALFLIAFAFVLALLLHFSLAISRLSDETKILAQQVARLDLELREAYEAYEEAQRRGADPTVAAASSRREGVLASGREHATGRER